MNARFGEGAFDVVREVWATSLAALARVANRSAADYADAEKSFSVFATEFPIHGTVA